MQKASVDVIRVRPINECVSKVETRSGPKVETRSGPKVETRSGPKDEKVDFEIFSEYHHIPGYHQGTTTLRGLENYFKNFDDYVAQDALPNINSALTLLKNYESSSFCTSLCEFLPFPEEDRVQVTNTRYNNFLLAGYSSQA